MKKATAVILLLCMLLSLCACAAEPEPPVVEEGITVPDLVDVEEDIAKNVLSANALIPFVTYEYNDTTEEGCVVRTVPIAGESVDKNSKIEVIVSNGPKVIHSKDSTISWYDIGSKSDDWNFYSPYIDDGILYIECNVTFGTTISWKNDGFGNASINDTFDKTVPIVITHSSTKMKAGKEYNFTLEIPLNDLDVSRPTTMHLELFALKGGKQKDIKISFNMTW